MERKEITSKDNRIYRECLKLSQKKYRDKEGEYLIEGNNLLEEAIKNKADIRYMIVRETLQNVFLGSEDIIYSMKSSLFDRISQTENSQGIICVVKKPNFSVEKLEKSDSQDSNYIILDRLQDPGNIGTIIRTADGAGYKAVIAVKGTGDIFSPKVIRAAAGSVFRIPIVQVECNRELTELVKRLKKKLVVTCFDTDKCYFDVDLSKGIALVIGNEGNGVSCELIEASNLKIKIPMHGSLESLNASVAAGIIMYEAVRREKLKNI